LWLHFLAIFANQIHCIMKKFLLLSVFATFLLNAFLIKAQELVLLDKDGNDITNGELFVEDIDVFGIMKAKIFFRNDKDVIVSVLVRKVEVDVIPGTINYFCWNDACLDENTFEADVPILLEPGETSTAADFYADYIPDGKEGTSIIKYEFFSDREDFETVEVIVHFVYEEEEPNSIIELPQIVSSLNSLFPNPAKDYTEVNYTVSSESTSSIRIYSITGRLINEILLDSSSNKYRLDTSSLQRGMFMVSFVVDNIIISTRKLVVSL